MKIKNDKIQYFINHIQADDNLSQEEKEKFINSTNIIVYFDKFDTCEEIQTFLDKLEIEDNHIKCDKIEDLNVKPSLNRIMLAYAISNATKCGMGLITRIVNDNDKVAYDIHLYNSNKVMIFKANYNDNLNKMMIDEVYFLDNVLDIIDSGSGVVM